MIRLLNTKGPSFGWISESPFPLCLAPTQFPGNEACSIASKNSISFCNLVRSTVLYQGTYQALKKDEDSKQRLLWINNFFPLLPTLKTSFSCPNEVSSAWGRKKRVFLAGKILPFFSDLYGNLDTFTRSFMNWTQIYDDKKHLELLFEAQFLAILRPSRKVCSSISSRPHTMDCWQVERRC